MTQEYEGFPHDILGGDASSNPSSAQVDLQQSKTTSPEPVSTQGPSDPFLKIVAEQIDSGTIEAATPEWFKNNLGDVTLDNGFTPDQIRRYKQYLELKNPLMPGVEDEVGGIQPLVEPKTRGTAAGPKAEEGGSGESVKHPPKKKWSMRYVVAKNYSRKLGEIIDQWGEDPSRPAFDAQALLLDVDGLNSESLDDVVSAKNKIDNEMREMEAEVASFINSSEDYKEDLGVLEDAFAKYKEADDATKRAELAKEIEILINRIKLVGKYVLSDEVRGLAEVMVQDEKRKKRAEFSQLRKQYETTHQEILDGIKSQDVNLGDEIRGLSPVGQYNLLDHLVRELESSTRLAQIDQMPEPLKTKIETVMNWLKASELGIDVPIKKEVAEVLGARIRLDQTWKVVSSLDAANASGFQDEARKKMAELISKGRLLTAKDVGLLKGASENSLGLPCGQIYKKLEQSAINKNDPRPGGEWSPNGMDDRGRIQFFTYSLGVDGLVETDQSLNGIDGSFSRHDADTLVAMAEKVMFVTGEKFIANVKGSDPLSAAANFRASREANIQKMVSSGTTGDPGPDKTIKAIPFLITSADRIATYEKDKTRAFHPEIWSDAVGIAKTADGDTKKMAIALNTLTRATMIQPGGNNLLVSEAGIDYSKLPSNYLLEYWGSYLPNGLKASERLLKSSWLVGDFKTDELEKIAKCFSTIDPTIGLTGTADGSIGLGVMALPRQFWRGVFSEVVRDSLEPENELAKGWVDLGQVSQMLRRVVASRLISNENLNRILKETDLGGASKTYKFLTDLGFRG